MERRNWAEKGCSGRNRAGQSTLSFQFGEVVEIQLHHTATLQTEKKLTASPFAHSLLEPLWNRDMKQLSYHLPVRKPRQTNLGREGKKEELENADWNELGGGNKETRGREETRGEPIFWTLANNKAFVSALLTLQMTVFLLPGGIYKIFT